MAPYSLNTQMLIVVACVTLHNFIREEARKDWLFEQYGDEDLVIVDSDNDDDEDAQVGALMPSHLTNEMNQFRDDLAKLMERALG